MPPSLSPPAYDASQDDIGTRAASDRGRLPMAGAGAVILGLSVAGWVVLVQGVRVIASLVG